MHTAQQLKAGPAFLSLTVFSCCLGHLVLLCRQAKDCGIKIPRGPSALTTKELAVWEWGDFGERGGVGDFTLRLDLPGETVRVTHLGGWLCGTHITVFSPLSSSTPHSPLVFGQLHLYFLLGLSMAFWGLRLRQSLHRAQKTTHKH